MQFPKINVLKVSSYISIVRTHEFLTNINADMLKN